MLDTDTLVYFIKNKPPEVATRIKALRDDDQLVMSFVTYAELLKGAQGSSRQADVLHTLDSLTRQVAVLYPRDRALCDHYAAHAMRLRAAGTPIGNNDLWIACHALAEAATLVTNKLREFSRVDGLSLQNWALPASASK